MLTGRVQSRKEKRPTLSQSEPLEIAKSDDPTVGDVIATHHNSIVNPIHPYYLIALLNFLVEMLYSATIAICGADGERKRAEF